MADAESARHATAAHATEAHATDAHAPDDIASRRVLIGAALVAGTVLVAAIAVAVMNRELAGWFGIALFPQTLHPPRVEGAAPQPAPANDLERLRAEKRRMLHEYRWLDRAHGVVRIPIEQAMQRLSREKTGAQ
jgi:hypothetical protein